MTTRFAPEELVELDSPVAEFFRTLSGPWPFRPLLTLSGKHFIPTADIFARDGELVVKVDLPGIAPEHIHVKLDEDELTITGERKADNEVKDERYYRRETSYGFFERRMTIPKGTKESDIAANYEDGVLEITMPKVAQVEGKPKAKEIPVKPTIKPVKV